MNLRELRDTLLRIDHPEKVLELADQYMDMMRKAGDEFRLPKDHAIVKPLLEYYSDDLKGWVKFVSGIRNRLPMSGRQFHPGLNDLFRKLDIRLTQQERRERITAAVDMAVKKKLIPDVYADKIRYANRCTQFWKKRRELMLKESAARTKSGKISVAEREVLLEEFWSHIEQEIANGELPKP